MGKLIGVKELNIPSNTLAGMFFFLQFVLIIISLYLSFSISFSKETFV